MRGSGSPNFLCLLVTIFVLKTKNAKKYMILSFKMKGDVISDHFLMLWLQKDSLDTVGFRSFEGGEGVRESLIKSWMVDQSDTLNFTNLFECFPHVIKLITLASLALTTF